MGQGCLMLVTPDVVTLGPGAMLSIPNQTSLISFQFHVQKAVVALGPWQGLGIMFTNGLHFTVGL